MTVLHISAIYGWLLWRKSIDEKLIDRFVEDVHGHHKYRGCFVTTNHRANRSDLKLSGNVPDRFESLFDLCVNFESSRKVCMHPTHRAVSRAGVRGAAHCIPATAFPAQQSA
jgi:hypothetical protein